MKTSIKIELYLKCTKIVELRILELKKILKEVQEAANNETKSSVGDKHETSRAMAQLETEKLTGQLTQALLLNKTLKKISPKVENKIIALGSLVVTSNGIFYIAISLGKIEIKKQTYYIISPISPIGQLLLTKKEKDSFSFNNINYVIEAAY